MAIWGRMSRAEEAAPAMPEVSFESDCSGCSAEMKVGQTRVVVAVTAWRGQIWPHFEGRVRRFHPRLDESM